jgi:hypothetical protein
MTIFLDVIAAAAAPADDEPPVAPEVPAEPEPEPPAVLPSPSGVFLIHVAPSPRLDPSTGELEKVSIDDDAAGVPAHQKPFLVD